MNETDLLLLIQELEKRVSELEALQTKQGSGVVTTGVPNYVKEFLEKQKEAK